MEMSLEQRKEYIVLTAIDLINENGICNISTKVIAKRLGISEALIYKIYPKKNDLLIDILEYFSKFDKSLYMTAHSMKDNPLEGLYFIFDHILGYYENYPAIISVNMLLFTAKWNPKLEEKAKDIIEFRIQHMRQLIREAQETCELDKTADPELITDMLFSIFAGICTKWIVKNYGFPLKEDAMKVITSFLDKYKI